MQRAVRSLSRLHSLVVQHSCHEQLQLPQLSTCLNLLSEVQQLAAAALGSNNNSSSSWASQLQSCGSVRHMAGRTHSLSLKRANNKASWMAVAPYLKQQPDTKKAQQQQAAEVIQTAIPPLPTLDEPVLYQRIGKITGPYSVGAQVGWPAWLTISSVLACAVPVTAAYPDPQCLHSKLPEHCVGAAVS